MLLLLLGIGLFAFFMKDSSQNAPNNTSSAHSTKSNSQTSSNTISTSKPHNNGNTEANAVNSLPESNASNTPEEFETYKSSCKRLSLSYPSSWRVITKDDRHLALVSPKKDGFYLSVQLSCGKGGDVNQNFLGYSDGEVIETLNNDLLFAAQKFDAATVTGLGLATKTEDTRLSFGLVDNQGRGSDNITLSANLVPIGAGAALNNNYPLKKYQDFDQYNNLKALFKSIAIQ